MWRFVSSQLLHRRSRAVALAAGILVASVSFTLLTSAARTSELDVKQTLARNFRGAYDVLVRPPGSFTGLEREAGLIQQNYLSGIFGGITRAQYRAVEAVDGVEVAAPIANVGFVPPFEGVALEIPPAFLDETRGESLYRLKVEWLANNGLSRYPDQDAYVYLTRRDPFERDGRFSYAQRVPGEPPRDVCSRLPSEQETYGTKPFRLDRNIALGCFSAVTPHIGGYHVDFGRLTFPHVGTLRAGYFPMLVAAIDPEKEERLLNLGDAIVSGRMLRADDGVERVRGEGSQYIRLIGSTRTYVDEEVEVTVELLDTPPGRGTSRALSSAGAFRFVRELGGREVGTFRVPLEPIYERLLDRISEPARTWDAGYPGYWQTSPTRYDVLGPDRIAPHPVRNPPSVFKNSYYGCCWAPWENRDVQYRKLASFEGNLAQDNVPKLVVVGRYDPERLPGFSPLSEVPLETYYPPVVEGADERTRELLGGRGFLPTQNIGGYVSQPPLLLTTLDGLRSLTSSYNFFDADDSAPISVIRVRVAGVTGTDRASRERIRRVAEEIHTRTGLAVDVTAGSSPHPVTVALPEGLFGQPPLLLREGWVEKGVTVRFLDAVDEKSLALFALILVVCSVFLANSTTASVKARRAEIGILACVGWSRSRIFGVVLMEVVLAGCASGIVGVGIAFILADVLSLKMTVAHTLLVVPTAALLALTAGAVPAWRAARTVPLDAIRPATHEPRAARHVRGVATMALANLRRTPSRTALAVVGITIGVAALTLLAAINAAFQGVLVGNLLGTFISFRIRGVDFVSVAFVFVLGAASVADVLFVNLRERAAELVTLKTTGWDGKHVALLTGYEALAMGLGGSALGVTIAAGLASQVEGLEVIPVLEAGAVACLAGTTVALAGALLPIARLGRLLPPTLLAEE